MADDAAPLQPLTHHDIIGLIEPFTRCGHQLDLPASNRLERQLVFKPAEHAAGGDHGNDGTLAAQETLRLDNPYDGRYQLTRLLKLACGLQASLQADGTDPAALLAAVNKVPVQRQYSTGAGFTAALSQRLGEVWPAPESAPHPDLILTDAVAQVGGLTLHMRVSRVRGVPADIELHAPAGDTIVLPEDLLAVVGWDWARLSREKAGWSSKLRLRAGEPQRSARAEAKLERTLRHLAQTLAEPPARFHERLARARWGAAFRRAIPLLTVAFMLGGALLLPRLELQEISPIRMLIFNAPTLLIAVAFCLQELPRFEIPPLPRRSKAAAWRAEAPHDKR